MGGMKSMGRYGRTKNWERVDEDHIGVYRRGGEMGSTGVQEISG